uniref:Uncharacterized protein n=1 Tax=Arundo donax TaxID=35708 RepID=A0A0A9GKC7_ARUDO
MSPSFRQQHKFPGSNWCMGSAQESWTNTMSLGPLSCYLRRKKMLPTLSPHITCES